MSRLDDVCRCAHCLGLEDGIWRDDDAYLLRRSPLALGTLPARPCACCGQPVNEDGTCACGWTPETLLGPHLLACPAALPF
jgi:hypothetical protein